MNNDKKRILDEVDAIANNEQSLPLHDCYFSYFKDTGENGHPRGLCIHCDWKREMDGLDWDHPDFIEYWDYPPYWNSFVKVDIDRLDNKE